MTRFELVIVGGGLASARAIKSYREAGGAGSLALLSADTALPYHRPPLSKRFLRGESGDPLVEDEAFYREHDVEVLLGTRVTAVDTRERVVASEGGSFGYERLVLATGAWPRRLRVPGAERAFTLRTLADSRAIREAASRAARALVVGGGFIGMEVAGSLRQLGLEVTLVHAGRGLFDQLRFEQLSRELVDLYREHGIDVLLEDEVTAFEEGAATTKSGRRVEAHLAVVGIGVEPVVGFLGGSGIEIDNGVVVNERFETSVPGVYAVGDVASFHDPLFGRRRRIEHWSNASYQGGELGRILAGAGGGYDTVSSFFTEVLGVTIKVFGDTTRHDELVTRGSFPELVGLYGERGRLVGALTVGQSEHEEARLKELIAERAPLPHEAVV